MATVSENRQQNNATKSAWDLFSPQQQKDLVHEDLTALSTVSVILLGVVTLGLLGMVISVIWTL